MRSENDVVREISRDLILMRLYRIFRIGEEDYITSVKLFYIYDNVRKTAGDDVFVVITEQAKTFKDRQNRRRLNKYYYHLQGENLRHTAAPPEANPPGTPTTYSPGWKCG